MLSLRSLAIFLIVAEAVAVIYLVFVVPRLEARKDAGWVLVKDLGVFGYGMFGRYRGLHAAEIAANSLSTRGFKGYELMTYKDWLDTTLARVHNTNTWYYAEGVRKQYEQPASEAKTAIFPAISQSSDRGALLGQMRSLDARMMSIEEVVSDLLRVIDSLRRTLEKADIEVNKGNDGS